MEECLAGGVGWGCCEGFYEGFEDWVEFWGGGCLADWEGVLVVVEEVGFAGGDGYETVMAEYRV